MKDTEWICSALADCFFPLLRPYQASGSSAESFDKYPVLVTCTIYAGQALRLYYSSMTCLLYDGFSVPVSYRIYLIYLFVHLFLKAGSASLIISLAQMPT